MEFINFLRSESEVFTIRLIVLFSIVGIVNGIIVAIIITSAGGDADGNFRNLVLFCLFMTLFAITRKYALVESSIIIEQAVTKIRTRLADKIRHTELLAFERVGQSRFHTSLARETMIISEAAKTISGLLSSLVLLLVAFLYVAYLSDAAFYVSAGLTLCAVLIYRNMVKDFEGDLVEASLQENRFFEFLNHMLEGFKELKISRRKSDDLYENDLLVTADKTQELKIRSTEKLSHVMIFGQTFFFGLMGFMIFIFPMVVEIDPSTSIQVVTIILFITTGPLNAAVSSLPSVERANVAVQNLKQLETELEQIALEEAQPPKRTARIKPFESFSCSGLSFAYRDKQGDILFQIGPIDFELKRGETVFIMGGNGAGKSTFLKTITGLYPLTEGTILCNSQEVKRRNIQTFRSYFTIIFQDYHLFERLYGIETIDRERVDELLERMQLADITGIREDGYFENTNLSTGQKKRLALIVAELDDREIYVFDEWAADQDPKFRKYFYEVYLKDLKNRGKTVLAVTHDDRYYHTADRILQMEYGKLIAYQAPS